MICIYRQRVWAESFRDAAAVKGEGCNGLCSSSDRVKEMAQHYTESTIILYVGLLVKFVNGLQLFLFFFCLLYFHIMDLTDSYSPVEALSVNSADSLTCESHI